MDCKIETSLADIRESFQILGRLKNPAIHIELYDLEHLKENHKERISLNLEALKKCLEEL